MLLSLHPGWHPSSDEIGARYDRGLPCAELWRRDWNHFLTESWEPLQGLLNLPEAPKARGCRPEEIGQNTATASICSRRTVKKFRIRLRRIGSSGRGIQRHAICLMLDPFLPVDDLSNFLDNFVSRPMLLNMGINLSEISLRSLTTLTPRIPGNNWLTMMAIRCVRMWPSSTPSNPFVVIPQQRNHFSRELASLWSDTERLRFRCVNHDDVNQQLIARELR